MTSLDFKNGDTVFVIGRQDDRNFDDTECVVEDVQGPRSNGGYTIRLQEPRGPWYVVYPKNVQIYIKSSYDPTQQPYDENDI